MPGRGRGDLIGNDATEPPFRSSKPVKRNLFLPLSLSLSLSLDWSTYLCVEENEIYRIENKRQNGSWWNTVEGWNVGGQLKKFGGRGGR